MAKTVIEYILDRLADVGVADIFGVPGDYAFPINDAIVAHPRVRWVGCCNELNVAYAADGYARIRGIGAVSTTYGVGELSAISGIAGAYAEHLPVFHIVGMPNRATQAARTLTHHTLGNGEYDLFHQMSAPVVCAQAVISPQNAAYETERLIASALLHRQPVYFGIPADVADAPLLDSATPIPAAKSDAAALEAVVGKIVQAVDKAQSVVVLVDSMVARLGVSAAARALVETANLPFAALVMGKAVLDEQHPNYIGIYAGALMNEAVRERVEGSDCILSLGGVMTDANSAAFTARLDPARTITLRHHEVDVGGDVIRNVEMGDVLTALADRLKPRTWPKLAVQGVGELSGAGDAPIDAAALYPRWERFIRPDDVLVTETGSCSVGLNFAHLPSGVSYLNQALWGSIGWATPAAFGAAMATQRRVVLVTGEGSHQLTAQELSQFIRYGLKPVIFVLNNNGYMIERFLCKDPSIQYNDLAKWRYVQLPQAFGADDWFTARVTTCAELDSALAQAESHKDGVYIEVVTDTYVAPKMLEQMHKSIRSLYRM